MHREPHVPCLPDYRAHDGRRFQHHLAIGDVDRVTLVFTYARHRFARAVGMNDEVRHLIVRREPRRECKNCAPFETLHKTSDGRFQPIVGMTARGDLERAIYVQTLRWMKLH